MDRMVLFTNYLREGRFQHLERRLDMQNNISISRIIKGRPSGGSLLVVNQNNHQARGGTL
jgi:hypothetical protein